MKKGRSAQAQRQLTQPDYEILAEFRYLLRRFSAFSEEAARREGLPAQQHQALLAIKGFPGRDRLTVGELAKRLGVRHHSMVGLIDRLAARQLVYRHRDTADRRQVLVSLTEAGEATLVKLTLAHRQQLRRMAPLLRALLERLRETPADADSADPLPPSGSESVRRRSPARRAAPDSPATRGPPGV